MGEDLGGLFLCLTGLSWFSCLFPWRSWSFIAFIVTFCLFPEFCLFLTCQCFPGRLKQGHCLFVLELPTLSQHLSLPRKGSQDSWVCLRKFQGCFNWCAWVSSRIPCDGKFWFWIVAGGGKRGGWGWSSLHEGVWQARRNAFCPVRTESSERYPGW